MEGTVVAEGRLYRHTQSPLYIRELSAARLTGGLLTPPALCATSPNARRASGEALAGTCCEGALAAQARRAADSRPYGKCGSLVRGRRGRCLHRPVPRQRPLMEGAEVTRDHLYRRTQGSAGEVSWQAGLLGESTLVMRAYAASGGELFTAEKFPKCAGGCGPRSPFGLCGVHPRKRHCAGSRTPPGRPVRCPLPLQGFARDSKIARPLRLRGDSLRPHRLPRNRAGCSTRQHYNPSVTASP